MSFKHHLTVTVLTDPFGQQTGCLSGGGGRMDRRAGVSKGHKAKMEGRGRQRKQAPQGNSSTLLLHVTTAEYQITLLHSNMLSFFFCIYMSQGDNAFYRIQYAYQLSGFRHAHTLSVALTCAARENRANVNMLSLAKIRFPHRKSLSFICYISG